jgi:hypothetical protein
MGDRKSMKNDATADLIPFPGTCTVTLSSRVDR